MEIYCPIERLTIQTVALITSNRVAELDSTATQTLIKWLNVKSYSIDFSLS